MSVKCFECGTEMLVTIKDHCSKTIGLPNVTLKDMETRNCPNCGDFEIVYPKIGSLHTLLAKELAYKQSRLTKEEIRYLRSYLDWPKAEFAKYITNTVEFVKELEAGRAVLTQPFERFFRMAIIVKLYEVEQVCRGIDPILKADLDKEGTDVVYTLAYANGYWRLK